MSLDCLDGLDGAQLCQILQHLLTQFDDSDELAITEEEIAERVEQDRQFLADAAQACGVDPQPAAAPSLREVIEVLAQEIPETRPTIEAAAARVRRIGTLPLLDIASSILVIATAAAILRPKLAICRSNKGEDRTFKLKAEAGGGKGLGTVLTTVLQFLGKGPAELP